MQIVKQQLEADLKTAKEMYAAIVDAHQKDEIALFANKVNALLKQSVISDEDIEILNLHY
jgi:hypothetical protein